MKLVLVTMLVSTFIGLAVGWNLRQQVRPTSSPAEPAPAPAARAPAAPAPAAPAATPAASAAVAAGPAASASKDDGGMLLRAQPGQLYFVDGSGQPVYLTGSHTWGNLQDRGRTDPPPVFDYENYLNVLQQYGHNFIRLWVWENATWAPWTSGAYHVAPMPYPRTGPGTAVDGGLKYELSQFDQGFFDRLRARVVAARDRNLYVAVMLFQGWSVDTKNLSGNPWTGHPYHRDNNINGIDGDTDGNGIGLDTHQLASPEVTRLQEAYVAKVIETVNDLDNVLYEISNESGPTSAEWQYHMIRFIKQYEANLPKQHPIGMTSTGNNRHLFDSPADWISPNGHEPDTEYRDNPPPVDGSKVVITDTDHVFGIGGDYDWVWKTFIRGANPIYMDPMGDRSGMPDDPPPDESARRAMGHTAEYARRLNLSAVRPRGDLVSSQYCLADVGSQYLVYLPKGGKATVDLSAAPGELTLEWFDPVAGTRTPTESVAGGAKVELTAPFSGSAVLFITR